MPCRCRHTRAGTPASARTFESNAWTSSRLSQTLTATCQEGDDAWVPAWLKVTEVWLAMGAHITSESDTYLRREKLQGMLLHYQILEKLVEIQLQRNTAECEYLETHIGWRWPNVIPPAGLRDQYGRRTSCRIVEQPVTPGERGHAGNQPMNAGGMTNVSSGQSIV